MPVIVYHDPAQLFTGFFFTIPGNQRAAGRKYKEEQNKKAGNIVSQSGNIVAIPVLTE